MKFTFFRRHLRKAAVIETLLGTVGIPVNLAVAALMARIVQSALSGVKASVKSVFEFSVAAENGRK